MEKKTGILNELRDRQKRSQKSLAVLVDPDKLLTDQASAFLDQIKNASVDFLFIGGSLLHTDRFHQCIPFLKKHTDLPIIIFPGSNQQIDPAADAILLLSMISGRNPEYLIGQHVGAAVALQKSGLEILPTAYMLIGDNNTTAAYISGSPVIPYGKAEIACVTALAGEQLGLQVLYADAGSGAEQAIFPEMISALRKTISLPLIIGGGIRSVEAIQTAWNAGADVVVVGSWFENQPEALRLLRA